MGKKTQKIYLLSSLDIFSVHQGSNGPCIRNRDEFSWKFIWFLNLELR